MNIFLYYPGYNQCRMNKLVDYFDPRIDDHKKKKMSKILFQNAILGKYRMC